MGIQNASEAQTDHTLCSRSSKMKAIEITTYSVLIFLSLVGNSLILAVVYRNKRLRTPVHYFIVNMAVSDLLIPTVYLPMSISESYFDGEWLVGGVLGTTLCKLVWNAVYISTAVSMFSMVAIAADRFYAIVFAMKPTFFSQKKCHRLIIIIWIVSVITQAYYLHEVGLNQSNTTVRCNPAFEKIPFLCLFALTAFVFTVLYSTIIFVLYRQKADLQLASDTIKLRAKENRKITSMLVILVLSFYVAWIPVHVHDFQQFDEYCYFEFVAETLSLFYTVINCSVFFIFNKTFRRGCRELIWCPWLCTNKCNVSSWTCVSPRHNIHNNCSKVRPGE